MNAMSITNEEENMKKKRTVLANLIVLFFGVKIQLAVLVAAVINF